MAIPLGEQSRPSAAALVERHFDGVAVDWFDRTALRRRPWRTLRLARARRYDAAVLIAPDLRQPRLRLTSLLVALPRAHRRWRLDPRGHVEAFEVGSHLARHAWPIVRHALACALAAGLAVPLLGLVDRLLAERRPSARRPKRILYLRSQLWLGLAGGGSVAHTAGVIGGLAQSGVDVRVLSSDWLPGVDAPTEVVSPETWFDGRLGEVEDLVYNGPFGARAWRAARRTGAQALYQRHTAFNCVGALLSRVLGLPFVLEYNSSELWKGRYWGGLRLTRAAALVERINLRAADRVVVVSTVLRDSLVAAGTPAAKILVNPNAVDPDQFHPGVPSDPVRQRLGLGTATVIGFSGTFGRWHGIPTLAEVIPRVLDARTDVRFLLIGDGPLRHLVEATIAAHDLHGRVVLPGLVQHAEMPAYLAACDVLVSPHGRQADGGEFFGSPTKLYEYMAAGRPIVASAVGQIADVLANEVSALLVPPDDPAALTAAIIRLVDDGPLRGRLAEAARRAAVERHTWRQNAERVLDALSAGQA